MQLIFGLAFLGLLVIAGGWLVRPTPPSTLRVPRVAGVAVLRPPPGRNAVLAAMAVGPTILVMAVALTAENREHIRAPGQVSVAAAVLLGLAVSVYFLVNEFRLRVRVDDAGVERSDALRRRRMAWGDVAKIAYNGVSRWFVLTSTAGTHLWIAENMAGIGDFADAAMARLPPEVARAEPVTWDALKQLAEEARREDEARGPRG